MLIVISIILFLILVVLISMRGEIVNMNNNIVLIEQRKRGK